MGENTKPNFENIEKHERGDDVTVKVVLIRHGEKVITQKTVTTAITEEGKEQARRFGQSRSGKYIKAYYSPTERTKETARTIVKSSPAATKGVTRERKKELFFGFNKGGEFISKVQQFRREALLPEAEGLSVEEIEERINQLKKESPEEFNRRLKLGADKHTEYYLNFGPNKPEQGTSSPVEIAVHISRLLLHYIDLSERLYSGSEVDLINVTHDVNIAAFLEAVLREELDKKEFKIGDLGGSIQYTEECEVIIYRKNESEYNLKLLFRGKEYNISKDTLQKLARTKYEK